MKKIIKTIPISGFDTLEMKKNMLHTYGKQSFGVKKNLKDILKTKKYGVECEAISLFDTIEESKVIKVLQSNIEQDDYNITEKIIIDTVGLLEQHDEKQQVLIINDILDNISKQERIYISKYYDKQDRKNRDQMLLSRSYKKHLLGEILGYINKYSHKLNIASCSNSDYAKLMVSIEKFPLLQEIGSIIEACNKEIDIVEKLEQNMNENIGDLEKNHLRLQDLSQKRLKRLSFKPYMNDRFVMNVRKFIFDLQNILQSDEYDAKYFINYYEQLIDIKKVIDVINDMVIKE